MYEDKTLVCKECGKEFVFTAGEQEFYAERGFQNEPQRCKACRDARKNAARGPREYFTATCAACGGEAKVPFEPKTDRPLYCSDCFAKMRENGLLARLTYDAGVAYAAAPAFYMPSPIRTLHFLWFSQAVHDFPVEKDGNMGYTNDVNIKRRF